MRPSLEELINPFEFFEPKKLKEYIGDVCPLDSRYVFNTGFLPVLVSQRTI